MSVLRKVGGCSRREDDLLCRVLGRCFLFSVDKVSRSEMWQYFTTRVSESLFITVHQHLYLVLVHGTMGAKTVLIVPRGAEYWM